jgi:SAM-dependent methyltransferase
MPSDMPPIERAERIRRIISCTACGGDLTEEGDRLRCACGVSYPRIGQAICFAPLRAAHPLDERPDSLTIRLKNFMKRRPRIYRILTYIFGISYSGLSPKKFLYSYCKPDAIIVTLGAGIESRIRDEIHVDLFAFPQVDVLADLTRLPFKNQSVDAVIMQSVIEHVADPEAAFKEIGRILRDGGYCYVAAPLIYPYHSSPNDFFRFTLDGLRVIGERNGLKDEISGIRHGPTSALVLTFAYWLAIPLSLNIRALYDIIVALISVVLMPPAHIFDAIFSRFTVSKNVASGYYFVGRKH